ncbi:DUF2382 domain-containing protein [Pseudonocardia charpentierae]|uniref:DUF2382 domain-containing protein n=1 Tax=Pseudonocardia charpentierae TaxID=3075545 RepID=A0ABU2NK42_9PSEU|nr:DUF2382 domain-containing protein [Pseudonocardia sp. DSM 45834]MDT0353579.1 DUF2382 domain-containing protein [Pseudonocardia sp. DSM 45834]
MTDRDIERSPLGTAPHTTKDRSLVRSEERLLVATEAVPVARVRLRKYLVTEDQTFTVPVTREEVELDYAEIPMTEQIPDGAGLLDDFVEVVRYEERVVVTKQVVAVERVRLVRRVITAEQVVSGQVRREVVDLDHTGTPGPTRTGTP